MSTPLSRVGGAVAAGAVVALMAGCGGSSHGAAPAGATTHDESKSYGGVSRRAATTLETSLTSVHGVRSVSYYPASHRLLVVYQGATLADEQLVARMIKTG